MSGQGHLKSGQSAAEVGRRRVVGVVFLHHDVADTRRPRRLPNSALLLPTYKSYLPIATAAFAKNAINRPLPHYLYIATDPIYNDLIELLYSNHLYIATDPMYNDLIELLYSNHLYIAIGFLYSDLTDHLFIATGSLYSGLIFLKVTTTCI